MEMLNSSLAAFSDKKYSQLGVDLMDSLRLPSSYNNYSTSSFAHKHFLKTKRWLRKVRKCAIACKTGIVSFCFFTILLYVQLSCGLIQKCFLEEDFHSFKYPANIEDFSGTVRQYIESPNRTSFYPPPINVNHTDIKFLENPKATSSPIGLLIIVKSATRNSKKRESIRKTWGNPRYLQTTFLSPQLPTVVTFICGLPYAGSDLTASQLFPEEVKYRDMILAGYHDTYGNNTYKTLLAMRWAVEHMAFFEYLMIVDDDMYVNPTNVVDFIKNTSKTKVQVVSSDRTGVKAFNLKEVDPRSWEAEDMVPLAGQPLIMGQALVDAKPFRSVIGLGAKWSMSVDKYPYNYFPPYVPGGAIIFDKAAVTQIYYGSLFTKHFWVDDVYIGIIAHKLGLKLTNTKLVDSSYEGAFRSFSPDEFAKMIAIHGLNCPEELVELWYVRDPKHLRSCWELQKAEVL